MAGMGHNSQRFHNLDRSFLERGYRWDKRDVAVVEVTNALIDDGRTLKEIADEAKVSPQTLYNWMKDDGTRWPQNAKVEAVMWVLGFERPWQRRKATVHPAPKKRAKRR